MELSEKQREIVECDAPKIAVIAAAASGKTHVLTERVRHLLRLGVEPSDICALTFTNMACAEMRDRLGEDYKDGLVISTIHALANRMLTRHGISTKAIIKEEEFDEFFPLLEQNPQCIEHYAYILLDEAQDSTDEEYNFIFKMINPENFFIVGDYRQTIYEQLKHVNPNYFIDFCHDPSVVCFDLNENYRNKANILTYAKRIIRNAGYNDTSRAVKTGGTIYEGVYDQDQLADWISSIDSFKDWAILCYTNTDINYIKQQLSECFIPYVSFRQSQLTKAQLDKLMAENTVKVLTVWAAKGLGFKNVCVYGYNWVRHPKERWRIDYVAATRAMNSLIWLTPARKRGRR